MSEAPRVLLTVSGTIPADLDALVAAGRRPRADYVVMAERMGAELLDFGRCEREAGRVVRAVRAVAGDAAALAVTVLARRHRYDVIVTDGEQIGLPLAAMLRLLPKSRTPKHMMIVHILSVRKKQVLFVAGGLRRRIDRLLVYCSAQRDFTVLHLGVSGTAVRLSSFMVDTSYFDPVLVAPHAVRPQICTAGLEFRDYTTLLRAVRGLDVDVVVAAASPWSKRSDHVDGTEADVNVRVVKLTLEELRQAYADATLVVVPLIESDFQAGITTILEAMSMAKAVVCTRTTGQTDTIVDGVTGVYVQPADPDALRAAITDLLADPARRAALGRAAREWTVAHADIDVYASTIAELTDELRPRSEKAP